MSAEIQHVWCFVFLLFNFPILAQLSGFSSAVSVGTQNKNDLKISETSGYLAPEYMSDGIIYIHPSSCLTPPPRGDELLLLVGFIFKAVHNLSCKKLDW